MHTQQVEQFTKLGRAFDDALLGHQPSIVVDYGDVMMLPASRCRTTAACLLPSAPVGQVSAISVEPKEDARHPDNKDSKARHRSSPRSQPQRPTRPPSR
jgi:hypothetical protein